MSFDDPFEFVSDWDDEDERITAPLWELPLRHHLTWEDLRRERKEAGLCPECGDPGEWVNTACRCPEHGIFIG